MKPRTYHGGVLHISDLQLKSSFKRLSARIAKSPTVRWSKLYPLTRGVAGQSWHQWLELPRHTYLQRPETWPKLITEKILKLCQWNRYHPIPYHQHIPQWKRRPERWGFIGPWQHFDIIELRFLAFIIVAHKNVIFLNFKAKLDKIDMFQNVNFVFGDLTWFDLTLISSWIIRRNECFHQILRPKWSTKHMSQRHSHYIFVRLNRSGYT